MPTSPATNRHPPPEDFTVLAILHALSTLPG